MTTDTEKFMPDVHRELHRVNALGDVVAIEVSIQPRAPVRDFTFAVAASAPEREGKSDDYR